MGSIVGIALAIVAAVLLLALAREWTRYARGDHIISRRQMAVRVTTCVLLVAVLAMVVVGVRLRFDTFDAVLTYWGIAMSLAAIAMGLAVWDLRQVRSYARDRRAESFGRLSAYIRRLERSRGTEHSGGQ